MRHKVFGRKLHRNTKQRKQLFRSLAVNFILHDKLTTSLAKAKSVRPLIEKLVTKAKENSKYSKSLLSSNLNNQSAVIKLITVAKEMSDRKSGYTKLFKTNPNIGDNSKQALLLWAKEIPLKTAVPVEKEITKKQVRLPAPKVKKAGAKKKSVKK